MSLPTKFEGNWGIDSDKLDFIFPGTCRIWKRCCLVLPVPPLLLQVCCQRGEDVLKDFFGRGCFAAYFKVSTDGCFC